MIPNAKQNSKPNPPRQHVLVVVHPDGFIEVYGEKNIEVKIVCMPHVADSLAKKEASLEQQLPFPYREINWPGNKRASAKIEHLTRKQLFHTSDLLEVMRTLDNVSKVVKGASS